MRLTIRLSMDKSRRETKRSREVSCGSKGMTEVEDSRVSMSSA